ncbi:tyrosinase [Kitasatospora gansuensis]|uniref:Tyrosinase n=2 Tax=Kitasatospora gansuensis TaxID=258050 RepID=A0A7W7WEY1_9ACTN|nr:tyrosinase [Kitasatospora gansuensis]
MAEMAVVRTNIVTDTAARDAYVHGVNLLKRERTTLSTTAFGIPGGPAPVRTYDLFVIWHHLAMTSPVPPGGDWMVRNGAHRGPVFLPWHRVMLGLLEANLQRVLAEPDFGLPYWDWSADGSLAAPQSAPIWKPAWMGGQGQPVTTGPFVFDAADPDSFRVRIETTPNVTLRQVERGLRRAFGRPTGSPTLPTAADLGRAFDTRQPPAGDPDLATYDFTPWNAGSRGFRNQLEGFRGPGLHNQVHRWVGGDMGPASSPNDPVFFLHHCNVDRIWEGWMHRHGRSYLPGMNASPTLRGHRIDDPIVSPLGPAATPRSTLDPTAVYSYDVLP